MRNTFVILSVLMLCTGVASAQDLQTDKDYTRGWYIGAQAGMPMAEADFSSFGADKFRPGWSAGIHAGYRFTPVWSLELTAGWGHQFLAEQDCCFDRGYYLGSDHNRYRDGLPVGMQGWMYKDIKSRTFVQRYGLLVNMNILGFFNATRESGWRLDVSPAVYAVGTSSDLMTKADNAPVADNQNDWHLGYGGQAQVAYALARNMMLGIYCGFTQLSGKPMDGMPELHSTNFIIDAGVKFSFALGGRKKSRRSAAAPSTVILSESEGPMSHGDQGDSSLRPSTSVQNDNKDSVPPADTPIDSVVTSIDSAVTPIDSTATSIDSTVVPSDSFVIPSEVKESSEVEESPFPVISFSFNSIWIEPGERAKVKQIADMLKADKSIRIRVTGWCDGTGSEDVNKRVSLQRAEAVKRVLGQWLIPAERVETVGGGINRTAADEAGARIATTIEIL